MAARRWIDRLVGQVAADLPCGYHAQSPPASEPTALAALALAGWGQYPAARQAADWLAHLQRWDGSVGVSASEARPKWPTALAMLAWATTGEPYRANVDSALEWAFEARGTTGPQRAYVGHDTTLAGWSWAADTHSWLEPTALFALALKKTGYGDHPRCREAVRLLIDRQLPQGGANYGNTVVLGQPLLAHVHSTGLAMLALAGEPTDDPRIGKSLDYLQQELDSATPAVSLACGVLGLAAFDRRPAAADQWLRAAWDREFERPASSHKPSPHKLALLLLATAGTNPMLT